MLLEYIGSLLGYDHDLLIAAILLGLIVSFSVLLVLWEQPSYEDENEAFAPSEEGGEE